ncbi:GNAT family N-acetyltransferase [Streptomyces sp. FH025]|uniref:GNAT family N-acetyltransferase n=1 Tax=Streptomyces sp. FH025 TaxID=2815937 RepID=UPI001A9FABC9|nr:GNAT family N-acetyltransferase [Streptomyces sp. FH025]MBO1415163.1 GNAT family N-acetyltransferase [Streptomyces sp. FH025]
MQHEIRNASPEDLPAINAIGRAYSDGGWEIAETGGTLALDDAECVLVCRYDGQVAGWLYTTLGASGRIVVERVIIDAEHRKRGVGSALLDELARLYPDRCLVAGVGFGAEERSFYEGNGFLPADDPEEPMIKPAAAQGRCCSFRSEA